jgi:hypothetical protein
VFEVELLPLHSPDFGATLPGQDQQADDFAKVVIARG